MKKLVLLASLITSVAFAQRGAATSGGAEVNANLGFTSGAINLGATYEKGTNDLTWGGYFFMQTEKEDAGVPQTMNFGALMKVHVMNTSTVDAYIAPGFGISMLNDYTPIGGGTADDKTIIGPNMRIGAQYQVNPSMKVGLERIMFYNWFDDEVIPFPFEHTSLVFGFDF